MAGRSVGADYKYNHNGQNKDDEVFKGFLSADYWGYDTRLIRRWEVDPLAYEFQSPYVCFNNNPIFFTDILGLEGEPSSSPKRGDKYNCGDGTVEIFDGEKYVSSSDYVDSQFGLFGKMSYKQQVSTIVTTMSEVYRKQYLNNQKFIKKNPEYVKSKNASMLKVKQKIKSELPTNTDDYSWEDLFNVWLYELNSRGKIFFSKNAKTTSDVMKLKGVNQYRSVAKYLAKYGNSVINRPQKHLVTYGQNEAYETVYTFDKAMFMLGSYWVTFTITKIEKNIIKIHFNVHNVSGWESATRFRKDNDGNGQHDAIIDDKLIGEGVQTGGNLSEDWNWDETLIIEK